MSRRGRVIRRQRTAGLLEETDSGFRFTYDRDYLRDPELPPISLTLPKQAATYESASLFPCFAAVLAEGALADVQCRALRVDARDLFGRLLTTCSGDVIGSLQVEEIRP
jgi:serine/threonine-protein kinase HipA